MRWFVILGCYAIFLFPTSTLAQGCSDAGFCTIDSFKPQSDTSDSTLKNQYKAGASYGRADHSITAYAAYMEYHRQFSSRWSADIKITALSQSGNGITTMGVSDVFVTGNYRFSQFVATAGLKIPLMDAGKSLDGLPLPMDYQSSLGTIDLIIGLGYRWKNLQIIAALQQPMTQNSNRFFSESYPEEHPFRSFQSTNEFERQGDLLMRLSYAIKWKRWTLTPALLPIYHLGNDHYTDLEGVRQEIPGSEGLTLNTNIFLDFRLTDSQALQFSIGAPMAVRENRPDGLTRSLIANLEYRIKF